MSPRETIKSLIKDGIVTPHLRRKSDKKEAVQALQTILNELGFFTKKSCHIMQKNHF
jgi:hypothetical protein